MSHPEHKHLAGYDAAVQYLIKMIHYFFVEIPVNNHHNQRNTSSLLCFNCIYWCYRDKLIIYINWSDCYIAFYIAIWPVYVTNKICCNGWLNGFKLGN